MKKILAVALAVVMMFSISVVAFADQTITKDTAQTATADVVTTFVDTDASYTVTVPSSVSIAWGDTSAQDAGYSVESQLPIGATLAVSAAANSNGTMTSSGSDTLTFTVANGAATTFDAVNPAGTEPENNVTVSIASFEGVGIGTYTGTMTYTVVYTAA